MENLFLKKILIQRLIYTNLSKITTIILLIFQLLSYNLIILVSFNKDSILALIKDVSSTILNIKGNNFLVLLTKP